jgi:hypothetical protein
MTQAGKVTVSLLDDADVPPSFEVVSKSFGHDAPFIDVYFPDHDTPSGRIKGSKRLSVWKQASKASTFLKAVTQAGEGNKDQVIGIAVWTPMKEAPSAKLEEVENVEEVWPDKEDREFASRLWREYVIPRTEAINDSQGKGVYGKC